MRTLSSLGSKQLAHRKGRSALTALGIVLGVAILFGVLVSNATTQTGIDTLIEDFTGRADVLASAPGAFDATVPARVAGDIARLPDVAAVAPSLTIPSSADTDATEEALELVVRGIDLRSARAVHNYDLAAGRFFRPGAREVIMPRRLVEDLGIGIGDRLPVAMPAGLRTVRLVGMLSDTGAGRTDQGAVAFTSLETARRLRGVGAVISGASIVLADGTDVAAWIAANEAALPRGIDVQDASTLAEGFKDFVAILGTVFTFFAALTLFVGAFLIYLTLSMAVIERVRVYGTMRALGATRAQVRRVVILEAVVLGVVSTGVGLGVGVLLAKGLIAMVGGLFDIDIQGLTIPAGSVIAGVLVGIVVTLVSSLVPARRAAHLSPVVAMRGEYAREVRLSRAWIAGAIAATIGIAISVAGGEGAGAAGTPLILLGAVLLVPLLLRPMARLLGRIIQRLARGVGDVAVLHLVKERSRSAYTLALIMVVMAMIFSIGGMQTSIRRALDESIDRQFGADLQVNAAGFGTFDPTVEEELRATPGVGPVTSVRFALLQFHPTCDPATDPSCSTDPQDSFARVIDPATYFDVESFLFQSGTEQQARDGLARGGVVLIPEIQARSMDLAVGDAIRFNTSQGVRDFRLAATYVSFAAGPPEVVVGLPDARRLFNAAGANRYHLNVAPEADPDEVRAAIEQRIGDRYHFTIDTAASIKQDAREDIGAFFNIFYAILLVAGVVGLLGLANTLAMSVLQRFREIGVLRAIGTTRGQVRRMVLVESATMGAVAFALSIPLGLLLSILTLGAIEGAFGFDVPYVYPTAWLPLVLGFGILVAVAAALAPGRRAARLEVVSALQYE